MIKSFCKSALLFFSVIILISCANNTDNPIGRPVDHNKVDQLALCAGGMEQGLSAELAAELEKTGGKVTTSFTEHAKGLIFSNKDIASSDKAAMYNKYIECIYKMQDQETKSITCASVKESCMTSANTIFKQCIRREMQGCYNDCRSRGFIKDACVLQLCNYNKMTQDSREFYNDRCSVKEDYMNQESECAEKYSQCLTSSQ